jgi:GTPase SAR1 family protein
LVNLNIIFIGTDFFNKEFKVCDLAGTNLINKCSEVKDKNNLLTNLNIWDTSGNECIDQILKIDFYKKAEAFFVCCSYDKLDSLINVKKWLSHIKKALAFTSSDNLLELEKKPAVPVYIICNKYDLQEKEKKFGRSEIYENLKETYSNSSYFKIKIFKKVSAKKSRNIDNIFEQFIDEFSCRKKFISEGTLLTSSETLRKFNTEISFEINTSTTTNNSILLSTNDKACSRLIICKNKCWN